MALSSIAAPPTLAAPSKQDKWFINVSNNSLSSAQVSLLTKHPNFAIIPKHPSPRMHMWWQLRKHAPNFLKGRQMNLGQTAATYLGTTTHQPNQSKVVLTADKGVAMVVMNKHDYTDKALNLLSNTDTYRTINKDPTTKLRTHSSTP